MRRASLPLYGLVSVCFLTLLIANQATAQPAGTNATSPTGNFVAIQSPFPITLKLETNGTYEVRFGGQVKEQARPVDYTQRGTWQWNSERGEMLLKPEKEGGEYGFRRLRIDPQDSQRLQWIPGTVGSFSGGTGLIDYVTFKPKKD